MSDEVNVTGNIPSEIYVAIGRGNYRDEYEVAHAVADHFTAELASVRAIHAELTSFDKAERIKLQSELAACRAKSSSDLEILASFDCNWGIGGSMRHCPVHEPCMSHRLAEMRRERDEYKRQCDNFVAVLNDLAENKIPLVEAVRAIRESTHDTAQAQGEKS